MKNRKVEVGFLRVDPKSGTSRYVKSYHGVFHGFFNEGDESSFGVVNHVVAVVEKGDGVVETVYVENIKFI